MKLEKLLTLSQFVDYWTDNKRITDDSLVFIIEYNNFLKKPLTKEMFVNELETPNIENYATGKGYKLEYHEYLEKFEAAEKKAIFKNDIIDSVGITIAYFINKGKTLQDLAEVTKGELELQNVEL